MAQLAEFIRAARPKMRRSTFLVCRRRVCERGPQKRVAVLLEPARDRRLQRAQTWLWRCRRTGRSERKGARGCRAAGTDWAATCGTPRCSSGTPPLADGCVRITCRPRDRMGSTYGSGGSDDAALPAMWPLRVPGACGAPARSVPRADPPWHPPSASSGTTKAPGYTTRATRRCSASGRPDEWNPCTSRRCSRGWNSRRSACSGSALAGAAGLRSCSDCVGPAARAWRGTDRRAPRGVIAAALLATNYVYVMWNRAAMMEAPMVAFIVASWYCGTRAESRARWAGARRPSRCWRSSPRRPRRSSSRRSVWDAAALGSAERRTTRRAPDMAAGRLFAAVALAVFVAPQLGGLPVLQLADVGHAQAELHDGVARDRGRGFPSCTTCSPGCGSRCSSA